jgi:hypothetical protein
LPTSKGPIPPGIVNVQFAVKDDVVNEGQYFIEYVFENESLRHKPNSTLRDDMFEVTEILMFHNQSSFLIIISYFLTIL